MIRLNSSGKAGPVLSALDGKENKKESTKLPPFIGPGFMKRSSTFVTEGIGWRKKSNGAGSKDAKERQNLALKVRQKVAQLEEVDSERVNGRSNDYDYNNKGRMSRLVGSVTGGLKSWSSSEDVRQSVVGAFSRTVSVIKQRPAKNAKPTPTKPIINSKSSSIANSNKDKNSISNKRNTVSIPNRENITPNKFKSNRTSFTSDLQLTKNRENPASKKISHHTKNSSTKETSAVILRNNNDNSKTSNTKRPASDGKR